MVSSTVIVADMASPVADYFFFVKIVGCMNALCNIYVNPVGCENCLTTSVLNSIFCKFLFIRYTLDLESCHHSSGLAHPRTHGPLRPRRVVPSNAPVISLATSNFNHTVFFISLSFLLLRHSLACKRGFDLSGMARPGEALCGHLEGSMATFKAPSRPSLDFFDEDRFFFVDPHWIVNRIRIIRGWPIPGQLCVVSHNGYWNSLKNSFL